MVYLQLTELFINIIFLNNNSCMLSSNICLIPRVLKNKSTRDNNRLPCLLPLFREKTLKTFFQFYCNFFAGVRKYTLSGYGNSFLLLVY